MKNLILVVFSVISAASCNEFIVLSSPKSIEFKGTSDLPAESLSEVLSATLGYSIQSSNIWDGLYVNDPFNTAKSVVSVVVEGAGDLSFKNAKTFNLVGEETNFEDALLSKVLDHSHLPIDVNLVDKVDEEVTTPFGQLKKSGLEDDVKFLKPATNEHDKEFLNQIAYLQSLIKLFTEEKEKPTALNVRVSLKTLSGKHSDSSAAVDEAAKLLTASIEQLKAAVVKSFDGNAVFVVVTLEERHVRSKRQATPVEEPTENPYNLAELTSKNYPVVFNIMFWFTLIFVFSLIAISLALSNVEDKDSIIYRMTGARGKKDN
jgi:renin receptor